MTNFSGEDFLGLADNQCVLRPGAKHTAEWAILPTARPDYWAMVNAVRRLRDVNFKLDGSFAFLRAYPRQVIAGTGATGSSSISSASRTPASSATLRVAQLQGPLPPRHGLSDARLVLPPRPDGPAADAGPRRRSTCCTSTAFSTCWTKRRRSTPTPGCCASTARRPTTASPTTAFSCPPTTNRFGRDIAKNVDLILGPLPEGFGCEGVYWDEFEYSRYQYHYDDFTRPTGLPWDGVSADIDPQQHEDQPAEKLA